MENRVITIARSYGKRRQKNGQTAREGAWL